MNAARVAILAVGAVASVVAFVLMRHPGTRREPYRRGRAFTPLAAALGAGAVMAFFALAAVLQR